MKWARKALASPLPHSHDFSTDSTENVLLRAESVPESDHTTYVDGLTKKKELFHDQVRLRGGSSVKKTDSNPRGFRGLVLQLEAPPPNGSDVGVPLEANPGSLASDVPPCISMSSMWGCRCGVRGFPGLRWPVRATRRFFWTAIDGVAALRQLAKDPAEVECWDGDPVRGLPGVSS